MSGFRPACALLLAGICSCSFRTGFSPTAGADSEHESSASTAIVDESGRAQTGQHVHEAGEQSRCTDWLFTQPWASRAVWNLIIRDSAILLGLAATVGISSRIWRR